jgi:hypothetical protein
MKPCFQIPSCPAAISKATRGVGYIPSPLTFSFTQFNREELIATRRIRLALGYAA